jgi:cytochrome c oxidase cbb3-type subunit III
MKSLVRMALVVTLTTPTLLMAASAWMEKVPSREHERPNAMASDPEAAEAGELLFEEHCSRCHGKDANGKGHRPSLRSERVQETATPGDLHWILVNGSLGRGMPSWSKLPDPQLWQIVTFVKSLGAPKP